MFGVSKARKEILQKLVEKDWSPSDMAEELGKSPQSVYNHLKELEEKGAVEKTTRKAKTRPETVYSIGNGFAEIIVVLPGEFDIKTLEITPHKEALLRIWTIPQKEFHPYLEKIWAQLKEEDIDAVAVYGSVARGDASEESDIDLLIIGEEEKLGEDYGTEIVKTPRGAKMVMAQIYSREDFLENRDKSSFLKRIDSDLHPIYDPERIL